MGPRDLPEERRRFVVFDGGPRLPLLHSCGRNAARRQRRSVFSVSFGAGVMRQGKFRGLVYSLAALFIFSCIRHAFFVDAHLWNLGIEGSIALGFAMTFTAFDEIEKGQTTLKEIAKNKDQIIRNLEEDLAKERQEKVGEMALQNNRLMDLQKEFGEKESELSSIQILSDVLRKTTAEATEARDRASVEEAEKEKLLIAKTAEIDELKQNFAHAQEIGAVAMRDLKASLEEKHRLSAEIRSLEEKLAKSVEEARGSREKLCERRHSPERDRVGSAGCRAAKRASLGPTEREKRGGRRFAKTLADAAAALSGA